MRVPAILCRRALALAAIALALLPVQARATAQQGDELEWEGRKHVVHAFMPIPNVSRLFERRLLSLGCSANWRGFWAAWAVNGGKLHLTGVFRACSTEPIPVDALFGPQPLPVSADWFSGEIRLPSGRLIDYVHMGFSSLHEKDIYLRFVGGQLVERREIDHTTAPAVRAYLQLVDQCPGKDIRGCDDKALEGRESVLNDFIQWRSGLRR